jgi:hypothetical protein
MYKTSARAGCGGGIDGVGGDCAVDNLSTALVAINADGTSPTTLFVEDEGDVPGDVAVSGNALYWIFGGEIRSLSMAPQLRLHPSGQSLVVSWPTNYAGFDYTGYALESITNLGSPVWTSNLPVPAMVNGQKAVNVPVTGKQQFFRLKL